MTFLISTLLGYLLGSIPFGLLLTRAVGIDIRSVGSGNIGATNVLRTGKRWLAVSTLLLDAGKGAAAVLIARYFLLGGIDAQAAENFVVFGAGVGAFFGHVFPVWLGFKGGKGVATYIGVLLALNWMVGLIFCGVWLLIAATRRISSLAALTAAATAPLFAYGLDSLELAVATSLLSLVLYYRHAENIQRLIRGTEPVIGKGKKAG
jgi:glycerol-3-phosphate acyltransferase PlsY